MKTNYLLPNKYKMLGWVLFIGGIVIWLSGVILDYNTHFFEVKVLSIFNPEIDFNGDKMNSFFKIHKNNILDEIISLLIIIGGFLVGFTKEKIEDEFIYKLRKDSLVWAIIFNYAILLFAIVFIYDASFLSIMIYNMFTPLIFFIIRFNFLKLKSRSHEE